MAISGFYNSMNPTAVSLDTASAAEELNHMPPQHDFWEELEKYKSLFGEFYRLLVMEKILLQLMGVDVNIFLKDVYKYKPPSAVLQQEYDVEEYCGSSPDFESFFSLPGTVVRSRHNEDKVIYYTFFKNNFDDEGTYIELGAFDGRIA